MEYLTLLGVSETEMNYVTTSQSDINSWRYLMTKSNPFVRTEVIISTSNGLVIENLSLISVLDILALSGGKFGALRIIFTFFFSFFMPSLRFNMMLEQIAEVRNKPSPKGNRSFNEKKDDAVQVIKGRGRFISTCWQRTWMSCEGLMKRLCAPRSDFAKQVAQG